MGWTSLHKDKRESIKAFFTREFSGIGSKWEIVDVASTLNVAYIAMRHIETDEVTAAVCLLKHSPRDYYNFSYKDMDESMGPNASECPERILKLLSPTTNTYALDWRARCEQALAQKKNAAKVGDTIQLAEPLTFTDGHVSSTFTLVQYRKGIAFRDTTTGTLYRMPNWKTRDYLILT